MIRSNSAIAMLNDYEVIRSILKLETSFLLLFLPQIEVINTLGNLELDIDLR